jgi:hypothetical protein
MTKYLKDYTREIEEILKKDDKKTDWKKVLENHRVQIGFLQHERLIHLLVTLTFGIAFCVFMAVILMTQMMAVVVANFLVTIMLIGYLFHYFNLENGVQKLYKIDKEIQKRI